MQYARLATVAILLLGFAAPARAQIGNKFAAGAEVTRWIPGDPSIANGSTDIRPLWRLGHRRGWGWHWGLHWYNTEIDRSIGDRTVELGRLRVRPFMAGYGYTHDLGVFSLSGSFIGGFALTSFKLTPAANDAYRDFLGARLVEADAAATLVARPQSELWYDVNKKIGLRISAGYTIARPRVTVSSTLGDDNRRVRADMFTLKVGLAYSIF